MTAGAIGGWAAAVTNTADQVQSGSLLTAATLGGVSECDLGGPANNPITATNASTCSGTLAPSGTVPATGTALTSTVLADRASLAASAASLTRSACGPVQLANSALSSDPMLVRGNTVAYAQPGPLSGGSGLGLSGGASATGYAADVTLVVGPTSFTEAVWFKTTGAGTLLGFANTSATTGVSQWDRMLWVDNAGKVVFGVYPGSTVELTSPATYNNGAWHLATGTVSSTGMVLAIDGAAVASNTTTTTAQAYSGYWHVGWDNESTGWADPPTTPYLTGTLADAAIFPALSAAQVSQLYASGTQTTWNGYLTTLAATRAWGLGDDGTTAFTGTVPNVTPAACAFVDVTVGVSGASATCAAPPAGSACGAPSGATTLASLGATTAFGLLPTPAQALTVTVTIARDTTNTVGSSPYAAGLHLTSSMALLVTSRAFSATLTWPSENVVL